MFAPPTARDTWMVCASLNEELFFIVPFLFDATKTTREKPLLALEQRLSPGYFVRELFGPAHRLAFQSSHRGIHSVGRRYFHNAIPNALAGLKQTHREKARSIFWGSLIEQWKF
jgi:hypothetical protein